MRDIPSGETAKSHPGGLRLGGQALNWQNHDRNRGCSGHRNKQGCGNASIAIVRVGGAT
ncbi:hypothetical protein REMIM1_PE00020 (plasmid) [Rhizobium etli bv. mimosae str. Mim1]|nr:hypothetical protein REMIM1_PE00020 [Rhizobium etli bv. mimosae str. Mim1]